MNGTTIDGNTSGSRGGAIFNWFGSVMDSVYQSNLTNNRAVEGGASSTSATVS